MVFGVSPLHLAALCFASRVSTADRLDGSNTRCTQARFYFGDWKGEGGDDDAREVITEEPRSYSKRTQKGVDSWHVPLERSRDWLCARWQPQQQR